MKTTKKQLKQIIKEEIVKTLLEQNMNPSLEKEIFKMLDAGAKAARHAGVQTRDAIRLAGEYIDERGIPERFPNAHAWWDENYGTWDIDEMLEHWMTKKNYSMR